MQRIDHNRIRHLLNYCVAAFSSKPRTFVRFSLPCSPNLTRRLQVRRHCSFERRGNNSQTETHVLVTPSSTTRCYMTTTTTTTPSLYVPYSLAKSGRSVGRFKNEIERPERRRSFSFDVIVAVASFSVIFFSSSITQVLPDKSAAAIAVVDTTVGDAKLPARRRVVPAPSPHRPVVPPSHRSTSLRSRGRPIFSSLLKSSPRVKP